MPWFKQGEIIESLYEFRPKALESETIDTEQPIKFDRINYPFAIIVSQDCDLEWDYKARSNQTSDDKQLQHVLFCSLFLPDEIRVRSKLNSDVFRRVKQNQDERYHHLMESCIEETDQMLPELYADFKAIFALPLEFAYSLIDKGIASRKGTLPSPYLEDFMHRLYGFLGRVATPVIQE